MGSQFFSQFHPFTTMRLETGNNFHSQNKKASTTDTHTHKNNIEYTPIDGKDGNTYTDRDTRAD